MEKFLDQYGYIALLIGTFFEGETAILVVSSLIHRGIFNPSYTVFFGFAGSFASDWIYYLVGRLNGKYFIDKRPKLKDRIQPVRNFFTAHKIQILFTYRFLYGFRIIIPVIIGMSEVKPIQFLGYSILAGLMWASTISSVGYLAGRFLDLKIQSFQDNLLFIALGFACFGLFMGYCIKHLAMKSMKIR